MSIGKPLPAEEDAFEMTEEQEIWLDMGGRKR